jgi:hypothetical protein
LYKKVNNKKEFLMAIPAQQPRKGPSFDVKAKKGVGVIPENHKQINHSNFGCLLNTNYKPKTNEEILDFGKQYPEILEETLNNNDSLFKKAITIVDDIKTNPNGSKTFTTHTIGDSEYDENIKHIRSRFKAEIGNDYGKGGRLHIHASFFIVHTTKIQINLKPIVDAFNVSLSAKDLPTIKYYHVKSEKPTTDLYMTKYNYL